MYTIHSMFGSCSTQNPNCFSLMGRGVAWTRCRGPSAKCAAVHKNVDFLVVFRVLRKIVRFRFLLRGTDRFCCVKWSCGQCVQESPSTVSRCRRRPFSRHDFLQMLHSWCESKNTINPNHFQQRSTTAADRQADTQHSCERSNPT